MTEHQHDMTQTSNALRCTKFRESAKSWMMMVKVVKEMKNLFSVVKNIKLWIGFMWKFAFNPNHFGPWEVITHLSTLYVTGAELLIASELLYYTKYQQSLPSTSWACVKCVAKIGNSSGLNPSPGKRRIFVKEWDSVVVLTAINIFYSCLSQIKFSRKY